MNTLCKYEIEEVEEIEKEQFKIDSIEQVNWAFRKIRAYKAQIKETNMLADAEVERIEDWRKQENSNSKYSIEFFEGLITEYFVSERKYNPELKISTPYGKVTTKKQQDKWEYDEDKLTEWLEKNKPELVRTKKEPNKAELKKIAKAINGVVVDENGEIVEGISVKEQGEKINIKVIE
jgi:hypothetical protein